jgi:hypothetical protein
VSHLFRETAIGTALLKSLLHPGFLMNLVLSEAKKFLLALSFIKAQAVANGYYQVGEAKNQSVKLLIIIISLFISKD